MNFKDLSTGGDAEVRSHARTLTHSTRSLRCGEFWYPSPPHPPPPRPPNGLRMWRLLCIDDIDIYDCLTRKINARKLDAIPAQRENALVGNCTPFYSWLSKHQSWPPDKFFFPLIIYTRANIFYNPIHQFSFGWESDIFCFLSDQQRR